MATQKQIAANRRNAKKSTGPKTIAGRTRTKVNALKHGLTAAQITIFDERPEDFENFHIGLIKALVPEGALEEQLVERITVCAWRLRRVYRIEARLFLVSETTAIEQDNKPIAANYDGAIAQLSVEDLAVLNALSEELSEIGAERPKIEMTVEKFGALNALAEGYNNMAAERARSVETQGQDQATAKKAVSIGAVFQSLAVSQGPFIQLSRHETTIERSYHRALHDLERLQARRKGEAVMAPVALDISSGK